MWDEGLGTLLACRGIIVRPGDHFNPSLKDKVVSLFIPWDHACTLVTHFFECTQINIGPLHPNTIHVVSDTRQLPCLQDHSRPFHSPSPWSCLLIRLVIDPAKPGFPKVLFLLGPGSENMPFLHYMASLLKIFSWPIKLFAWGFLSSGCLLNNFQQPRWRSKKGFCQAMQQQPLSCRTAQQLVMKQAPSAP